MKGKTTFLTGLVIGGLIGILMAPSKGRKSRKKIAALSKSLKNLFSKKGTIA